MLSTKKHLQRHIQLVHIGARPFQCPECGYVLTINLFWININYYCVLNTHPHFLLSYLQCSKAKRVLQHHIKFVHSTDQSSVLSKCAKCGKVMKLNTKYIEHFIPKLIGHLILQMVKYLTSHMKMHSNVKPYSCHLCNKVNLTWVYYQQVNNG